jgi:hypothetical protein
MKSVTFNQKNGGFKQRIKFKKTNVRAGMVSRVDESPTGNVHSLVLFLKK